MTAHPRPPASVSPPMGATRFDLVVMVLALWMVGGVFVDGWAHLNVASTQETFFTPWHGILYSGFAAVSAWMAAPLVRHRTQPLADRIRAGYGLGFVGLVVFGAGGVGDGVWHELFGIEIGIDALLSPTHLLLLTGGLLVLTSPVRAAWGTAGSAPRMMSFLPALLSITLTAALLAFFFAYAWGAFDTSPAAAVPQAALDEQAKGHAAAEGVIASGILSRLLTTVILIGPLVVILRRWHPPVGTVTILFGTVSGLVFVLAEDVSAALLIAPIVAGMLTDLTIKAVGSGRTSRWWMYGIAASSSLFLWVGHFVALSATHGLGWTPELWGGAIVLAVLTAAGLAVVAFLPPVPAEDASPEPTRA